MVMEERIDSQPRWKVHRSREFPEEKSSAESLVDERRTRRIIMICRRGQSIETANEKSLNEQATVQRTSPGPRPGNLWYGQRDVRTRNLQARIVTTSIYTSAI